jgi:hypothetical protein
MSYSQNYSRNSFLPSVRQIFAAVLLPPYCPCKKILDGFGNAIFTFTVMSGGRVSDAATQIQIFLFSSVTTGGNYSLLTGKNTPTSIISA